ncbi:IS30 family transposase [Phycicoccus duodecadis]|uniref:IS30 family transposase n=1 Tax=Phycicoccus duodecadis TaxID=173053 RepID=A0A2N3YI23_9MICO|nr:IS30 family transposase [Phycicoccus duodecadis]
MLRSAAVAGVGSSIAGRWVRESGGVIRMRVADSGHRLSFEEREAIEEMLARGHTQAEIAREIGRARSTISREIARNLRPKGRTSAGTVRMRPYSARIAQLKAEQRARRPKPTKLSGHRVLAATVQAWIGGTERMSPQQVSNRLKVLFPDDESMRVSHETLYQELYVQGRGHLRADLHHALRTGRARRAPRKAAKRPRVPGELLIANRPKDVDARTVPGHWEGDLIIGKNSASAIGTLVERTTRFVILLHLPGRHDAESVADAIAQQITALPEHLARSLTWDQGVELVGSHQRVRAETGLSVWFCDPASPWQRGSNENTNGLLRQYFPKGTDLSVYTQEDLETVADGLNARPRMTLGWRTPAEALAEVA